MDSQCHASKEKLRIVRQQLKGEESVSEPCRRKGLTPIVVIFLLWGGLANAQNLVPNPSFEAFSQCPNDENDVNGFVDNWIKATGATPDYFNACNVATRGCFTDVPDNFIGSQAARTGDAYAGFFGFATNPNHTGGMDQREYLEVELTRPLVAAAEYRISFYVSLADASNWVIQEIGAFVSATQVTIADALPSGGGAGTGPIPVMPQFEHSGSFLDDADNWTLLSGTFTATGGEKWLIIGNFHSDADTTRQIHAGSGGLTCGNDNLAYYYVDDVSLLLVSVLLPVDIDIKPGSDPNAIHPMSMGLVPVAILGSDTFDVLDVDPDTLAFGPDGAALAHAHDPHFDDVNNDSFTDLIGHFVAKETGIAFGDTEACLTGATLDAMPFEACDDIRTVPACGVGFELALLLPPMMWLRRRRRH